jgi:glutathione S-transferase
VKLYDFHASPNCMKVRVAARELGRKLEIVPVDFEQTKRPDYLAQNPTGKVPALVEDDGTVMWESGAILVHLAERDPLHLLLPTEPHLRAEVFRWLFFGATHIQPWISLLGQEKLLKPRSGQATDHGVVTMAERELARFLPILDECLGQRDYLVRRYTVADIALGCGFEGAEARGIHLNAYPRIHAWRERLRARPTWKD